MQENEKDKRLEKQLDFIREIDKEKEIFRQTYLADASRKENDAEHAWHMAIMAYLLKEYANEPVDIAKAAMEHASKNGLNVVILDTAGRLHVDEDMMAELQEIQAGVAIDQKILVVDAMTGQDAVNVASTFNEKIGIDGVILTKLDGDTRGGAALSIKAVTGCLACEVGGYDLPAMQRRNEAQHDHSHGSAEELCRGHQECALPEVRTVRRGRSVS